MKGLILPLWIGGPVSGGSWRPKPSGDCSEQRFRYHRTTVPVIIASGGGGDRRRWMMLHYQRRR